MAAKSKRMDIGSLKVLLAGRKDQRTCSGEAAQLAEERSRAMDYYLGDMSEDMPVPEGRSQAVSNDVSDTVEGLMPSADGHFRGLR
jgi:hypothetical protein